MHIKEIIIDGFKSYAKRIVLNNLDSFFNAITGLNGSGKSNILDAICFLLGINTLAHVRVNNLQELIYKNGQSSVTQASVSIIFDNKDKTNSPIGYETYDEIIITKQIAVGGRHKNLINGCNATNSRISDLFLSVNLNINNPHFLIMQGRITKVLNMKPIEILSMLEEAAGTSLYENKKISALKIIEKKEHKLLEIDKIIMEEINPQITKLKEERNNYLELQRIKREIDNLEAIIMVHEHKRIKDEIKRIEREISSNDLSLKELENKKIEVSSTIKQIENELSIIEASIDKEARNRIFELEKTIDEHAKDETRYQTKIHNTDEICNKLLKINSDLQLKIDSFNRLLIEKVDAFKVLEHVIKKITERKTKEFDNALTSSSSLEFIDQLKNANERKSAIEMEVERISSKYELMEEEVKKLLKSSSSDDECSEVINKMDFLKMHIKLIEENNGSTETIKAEILKLKKSIDSYHHDIIKLKKDIEYAFIKFPNMNFDYTSPSPNFDNDKVYGTMCTLFYCEDTKYITALEATAGGKLFNVVVDSDETSKQLIKSGNLSKRTTFIALNIVRPTIIKESVVNEAQKIAHNKVYNAYSLITCHENVNKAMMYAFGNTLICESSSDAKKLAYDKRVNCRCVTIDGDIFDPSGVLTGGSHPTISILHQAFVVFNSKQNIALKTKELNECTLSYQQVSNVLATYDEKIHELEIMQIRLSSDKHYKSMETVQRINQDLDKMKGEKDYLMNKLNAEINLVEEIKLKMNNSKIKDTSHPKNENLKKTKIVDEDEKNKRDYESLKCQIEDTKKEISELELQMKENVAKVEQLKKEISILKTAHKGINDESTDLKVRLQQLRNKIRGQNEEISIKNQLITDDKVLLIDINNQIQILKKKLEKFYVELKENNQKSIATRENVQVVEKDNKYYTSNGQCYNFDCFDIVKSMGQLGALKDKKKILERMINARAMNMLESAEEKYNELINKKNIVNSDKLTIQQTIEELDIKKKNALYDAWKCVNKNFNEIFSSMLPNASACLQTIDNLPLENGLEIKVGFGSIWKESLNELSGGQRSLVALSLILSMLLFKPAPIYILDEIDAALDISHTQNIGSMLKNHFKKSQFIIVSLKDGMFNNANVLFRTKFVDGSSTVSRFQQRNIQNAS